MGCASSLPTNPPSPRGRSVNVYTTDPDRNTYASDRTLSLTTPRHRRKKSRTSSVALDTPSSSTKHSRSRALRKAVYAAAEPVSPVVSAPNSPSSVLVEDELPFTYALGEDFGPLFVRVLADFAPEQEGDLDIKVDDVIEVAKRYADGWWTGFLLRTGEPGLFPSNFTESCERPEGFALTVPQYATLLAIEKFAPYVDMHVAQEQQQCDDTDLSELKDEPVPVAIPFHLLSTQRRRAPSVSRHEPVQSGEVSRNDRLALLLSPREPMRTEDGRLKSGRETFAPLESAPAAKLAPVTMQ